MESNKAIPQHTNTLASPIHPPHLTGAFFTIQVNRIYSIAVIATLVVLMNIAATNANAAPADHIRSGYADAALHGHAQSRHEKPESWARGRILVMPRAGLPARAFMNILDEYDGKARKIGQSNLYVVDLPEYSEEGVIARLEHNPHLKFAELDHLVSPSFIPDDPYFGSAWHLPKIGTPIAWDYTQGAGITIAILDSGVDSNHPDLATQMVTGWNFYDNNSDSSDIAFHGSYVAGAAAAASNNSTGVTSVAGQSKIMPLRITDTRGYGFYSTIAQGLTYAADHGARIANVSFRNVSSSTSVRNAAQYMKDKGGLVVVAGGNTGGLETFTATTTMISVSATDESDITTSWSSYGDYIALAAPGDKIWSTNREDGGYRRVSGTSFASPVTAGVIALMMAANPVLNSADIENFLFSTAVDLGDKGRDKHFGYGRVDAAAAVQAAIAALPIEDTEMPTVSITKPLGGATVRGLVLVDIEANDNSSVTHVELLAHNTTVAVDTSEPFAFSWDSNSVSNGVTNLVARVFDAAGNMTSSSVEVNVDNQVEPVPVVDSEPPIVNIINPVAGNIKGNVTISVDATDDSSAAGISLSIYIDDMLVATGTGSTLATSWNTRPKRVKAGTHTIRAVAKDEANNTSSTSVNINVNKK